MKVSKIAVVALFVMLVGVFTPKLSVSKDNDSETIVLSSDNTMVLNTEVDGDSTSKIIALARDLDIKASRHELLNNKKTLYLFLNTPGGSIQSGLEMIEALKGLGREIDTISLFAASMGFQIVQNLDTRLILKNGTLMSHHAAGGFEGSFGGVRPSQMDSRYQMWLDRIRELDEQTVRRTNGK
jgi:ATP-dependent protease ClpP protease subunit